MSRSAPHQLIISLVALAALVLGALCAPADAEAAAQPNCKLFTSKIYSQVNPRTGAQSVVARGDSAVTAQARGFTAVLATPGTASATSGSALVLVRKLYRKSNNDYLYAYNRTEIDNAIRKGGYADHGGAFYASTKPATCLTPMWSYLRAGIHRLTSAAGERTELKQAGWQEEGIRFYVGRPQSIFTFAVFADTQQEVWWENDDRFVGRSRWVNDTRQLLSTRLLMHTGDVVDWDTPDHIQYVRARRAMAELNDGIPYTLAAGNHDTAAVGPGGGAADPTRTRTLVRDTSSFNTYLGPGVSSQGTFESGRKENSYTRFNAGGISWLVLSLELWPRKAAVEWAKKVVAGHPEDNVIVVTHSYLTPSGGIYGGSDYGETSPRYLYDNLIKRYPNIKMTFSGHTGQAAYRRDVGVNGNVIHNYLMAMHSNTTNPTRMVEINVSAGTVASWIYAPHTKANYTAYYRPQAAVSWIR